MVISFGLGFNSLFRSSMMMEGAHANSITTLKKESVPQIAVLDAQTAVLEAQTAGLDAQTAVLDAQNIEKHSC